MKRRQRRTALKVQGGRVLRKNRWGETPNYYNTPQDVPTIDRQRPGKGYRHLLRKKQIIDFISIIPNWEVISLGLNAVVLAPGDPETAGWCSPGVVAICAWERDLWYSATAAFFGEHRRLFKRLGLHHEPDGDGGVLLRWTEEQARAYQLLHIFLHELGHHRDRMTTRSRRRAARGEGYAESYARSYSGLIWRRYLEVLGDPRQPTGAV